MLACLRPEDISIHCADGPEDPRENRWSARIAAIEPLGPVLKVRLDCGFKLSACLTRQALRALGVREGDPVRVTFPMEAVHLLEGPVPEP